MEQNEGYLSVMPTATVLADDTAEFDYDSLMLVAERADKMVDALNKMMNAALKITNGLDWVLIGGKPYMQESGATKVARLFGISWRILEKGQSMGEGGYPAFHYRMEFRMGKSTIEAEGSRSSADEFFTGKRTDKEGNPLRYKKADEICMTDVQKAAYTNTLNNGIKRLLPGLRNIDLATLESAGIKPGSGYTFKEGKQGGQGKAAANSGLKCSACNADITQPEASFSEGKFGKRLCRSCQKKPAATAPVNELPPPPDVEG